jgi:hypothetical protein
MANRGAVADVGLAGLGDTSLGSHRAIVSFLVLSLAAGISGSFFPLVILPPGFLSGGIDGFTAAAMYLGHMAFLFDSKE